jgi:ribosomal protein S21
MKITVGTGESIKHALRRFRDAAKRDGLFRDIRNASRRYSPPSVEKQQARQRRKWKKRRS